MNFLMVYRKSVFTLLYIFFFFFFLQKYHCSCFWYFLPPVKLLNTKCIFDILLCNLTSDVLRFAYYFCHGLLYLCFHFFLFFIDDNENLVNHSDWIGLPHPVIIIMHGSQFQLLSKTPIHCSSSTQPFVLPRSIKWLPGTPWDLWWNVTVSS